MDKPTQWWWNGRWGRLARRDIKIFPDGDWYRLEAWVGGVEGQVKTWTGLDMPSAMGLAEDLATEGEQTLANWRDMTAALRP